MTVSRKVLRELMMKLVYQYDFFKGPDLLDQAEVFLSQQEELTDEEREDLKSRYLSITEKIPELDEMVSSHAKGWKTGRMPKTDLSIMRLAVFEMLYDDTVPVNVAINEAVELAKLYGEDDSYKFINGVLGAIAREKQAEIE